MATQGVGMIPRMMDRGDGGFGVLLFWHRISLLYFVMGMFNLSY